MSSQHPFHYQELASIRVRGLRTIHSITKSQHHLGLGDFTAPILFTRASIHQGSGTSQPPFHYSTKFGNQYRLLNSYVVYELTAPIPLPRASIHQVKGLHSTHPIYQSQHPLGLGDFTASIPSLNKICNQGRLSNSWFVYEFTSSIPLPRASVQQGQGTSQHPSHYSTKFGDRSRLLNSYIVFELTASIPLPRASIYYCQGNSLHPFHYQELASIRVRGLHSIHSTTQQNLVTKPDC